MNHGRHGTIRVAERVESLFHRLAGVICRRWPRPVPPGHLLKACRIVSHRGEHDNCSRFENTLAAFDAAADAGVWGLEMDIRWTRDQFPIVFHDPDTRRLFNAEINTACTSIDRIKSQFPLIPTLSEVIGQYGGRKHLMLEIKAEPYLSPPVQARRLKKILRHLSPAEDYHLMGLHPEMFTVFDFLPASTFLPIAGFRMDRFSRLAAANGWGGVTGHYLLAAKSVITRHHGMGQGIGTGFADSRRCLFREVTRGVDWIFSNRAARMQAVCNGRRKTKD